MKQEEDAKPPHHCWCDNFMSLLLQNGPARVTAFSSLLEFSLDLYNALMS